MPRYLKINIICILFLVFTAPASSELYQYKDKNGIMRLTDDIYSVPTEERYQLENFSEFEGLSDGLEILPIQNKSLPQTKKQTKTEKQIKIEKVIVPKRSKAITATAEKKIVIPNIPPDAEKKIITPNISLDAEKKIFLPNVPPDVEKKTASKSKEEITASFQPVFPEKTIQAQDTKIVTREIYKSKKISIDKINKKIPVQKTIPLTPPKSAKKISKQTAILKTVVEPEIIYKDKTPKIITEKSDAMPKSKTETKKEITKEITKTAKPDIKGKIVPETKIVIKKQTVTKSDQSTAIKKTTKSKDVTAGKKADKPLQTAQAKPKKTILKKAIKKSTKPDIKPDIKKPATKEKTFTKTKEDARLPEKIAEVKPVQEKVASPVVKKETITKKIIADQKTVASLKTPKVLPLKNEKKNAQPEAAQKTIQKPDNKTESQRTIKPSGIIPEKKLVSAPKIAQAEPKTVTSKIIPDIRKKAAPVIKKADTTDPDNTLAKKDSNSVIVAQKTDQKKLAETEKPKLHARPISSEAPNLIKDSDQKKHAVETVTESEVTENTTKELNKKDESLILAQLQTTRQLLAEKKEALNKKFQDLMKKKQKLEDSVDEDDEKSVLKYNENVKTLNIKIKQYKKQKKSLQATIEEYNHMVKQARLK